MTARALSEKSAARLRLAPLLPAAYVLGLAVALLPLLAAAVPPLADYPNHLARMHVLAEIDRDPALAAIYGVDWKLLPNLAMDLVVPPLVPLLGVETAGKVFLALSLVLLVLGTVALRRALYGRAGFWPLALLPFLASTVLAYGLLNYLFGVGLMLLALACWFATAHWPAAPRLALTGLFALLLFFAHLVAFGAFGLCVLAAVLAREPRLLSAAGLKALVLEGLPFLPALVLLLAGSPTLGGELSLQYILWDKLRGLLTPVLFQSPLRDLLLAGPPLALIAWAFASRRLSLERRLRAPLVGLALAYLAMPTWLMDNWGNDLRLALPIFALLIAGARLRPDTGRAAVVIAAACALGLVARSGTQSADWLRYDALYAELRGAVRDLPEGAKLLPVIDWVTSPAGVAPTPALGPFYSLPVLALLERPLFVPSLFTAHDRQVLSVREPYRALDSPHFKPLSLPVLREAADPESAEGLRRLTGSSVHFHRVAGWPALFDVVLVIDFGNQVNPVPEHLSVLRRGSYFTLYRVLQVSS